MELGPQGLEGLQEDPPGFLDALRKVACFGHAGTT